MDAPVDPDQLEIARAAGARAGVTRLAELTGLDCLGVPVFQAVRPTSRALSVHQGKGLDREAAMLGALMEAVESHHAEGAAFDGVSAAWRDLPDQERSMDLDDFAADRRFRLDPRAPMRWVPARRLADDARLWAPFDHVSLDLSREGEPGVERSSTGLAARFDAEDATLAGLLEVLERDSVAEWRSAPLVHRVTRTVDVRSIGYPWFRDLHARAAAAGVNLHLYALTSVTGAPVVAAELIEPSALPAEKSVAGGYCCALMAEDALRGAVLEAMQSRLTIIAGARDDVLYDRAMTGVPLGSGCPFPPNLRPMDWSSVERSAAQFEGVCARGLVERLAACGYPDAAAVSLSEDGDPVVVVKIVVPGLADDSRRRRPVALLQ